MPAAPASTRSCGFRLDLDVGTLEIEATRVVVDGKVIESDGKTKNAQHTLALDPFTLAVLKVHVEMLDQERKEFGPDYHDGGSCSAGRTASPRTRTQSPAGSRSLPGKRACQKLTCTTYGTVMRPRAATPRSTGRRYPSASAMPTSRSP